MITASGPKVIEYNCRFGDPETQVVLPLVENDLYHVLTSCANGELSENAISVSADTCAVTVIMASGGYPGAYAKGHMISGLERAGIVPGVTVFHAGTKPVDNPAISLTLTTSAGAAALQRMLHHRTMTRGVIKPTAVVTSGGRVLAVTAVAHGGIAEARERAYVAVRSIRFQDAQYRKDIGASAISIPRPRIRSGGELANMARHPERKTSATYLDAGVDIEMDEAIGASTKKLMERTSRLGAA